MHVKQCLSHGQLVYYLDKMTLTLETMPISSLNDWFQLQNVFPMLGTYVKAAFNWYHWLGHAVYKPCATCLLHWQDDLHCLQTALLVSCNVWKQWQCVFLMLKTLQCSPSDFNYRSSVKEAFNWYRWPCYTVYNPWATCLLYWQVDFRYLETVVAVLCTIWSSEGVSF